MGVDCRTVSTAEQHRNRSFVTGGRYLECDEPVLYDLFIQVRQVVSVQPRMSAIP
ncbi:hypothetical protein S83_027271 [Arachis hypogaea]